MPVAPYHPIATFRVTPFCRFFVSALRPLLAILILTCLVTSSAAASGQDYPGSDLFKRSIDSFRTKTKDTIMSNPQDGANDRVCIIGSGNWGSAIATMVGKNCQRLDHCENQVNMWVFEETIQATDGSQQKLTDIINSRHENVKYLPGIKLPKNVVAVPDLAIACRGASLLIFVLPHQFLPKLLPVIRQHAHPEYRGVSLIKGLGT